MSIQQGNLEDALMPTSSFSCDLR